MESQEAWQPTKGVPVLDEDILEVRSVYEQSPQWQFHESKLSPHLCSNSGGLIQGCKAAIRDKVWAIYILKMACHRAAKLPSEIKSGPPGNFEAAASNLQNPPFVHLADSVIADASLICALCA